MLGRRLRESLRCFRLAFAARPLGWLQSAWACCITGEQCFEIALAVFAYKEGGIAAAGTLALVRAAVSALTAPLTAGLGDRFRRQTVLVANGAVLTVVAGTIAFAAGAGETYAVYGLSLAFAVAVPAYRPVQSALLPAVARSPEQLTASNVAVSLLEGLGGLAGPVIAGVLLATSGTAAALSAVVVLFAATTLAAARIGGPADEPRPEGVPEAGGGALHEALEGIRETVRNPGVRVLVGLYTTSMLVWGAFFQVLVVVIAIQRLDIGEGGAGLLAAVTGVGAMICAAAAASLVGRRRLAPALAVGVACWALPLAVMAVTHSPVVAAVVATLIGAGVVLVDVVTFTLLQRAAPDDVLARVFGVLESAMRGALGIGAVAVPALVAATDLAITLAIVAAVQPIALVIAWPRLRAVDSIDLVPTERITLLQSVAMFAPLPALPLERLAARLVPHETAAGETIVRQGDSGDVVYVIAAGTVDVSHDGHHLATLGRGEVCGEIALLRDVPRTATVVANEECRLFTLQRDEFLAAVTGHAPAHSGAGALVSARLAQIQAL
jgi:MFS family permease